MAVVKNLFFLFALLLCLASCRKENFTTDSKARLQTTTDTLHFDTVFTTTGSVSQVFKIFNNNSNGIRLSSVRLAGGAASPFRINVDGAFGPQVNDVEVLGNDSIYVYVTVNINPSAQNLPFLVQDSIELTYNGNRQWVQLDAFGQNANFYRSRRITSNEVWNNNRPYVILGGLIVDSNATLTINQGCKIYMHADAPFIINGSLQVLGDKYDSTRVVFTGDRLDEPYRNYPASYPGLIFSPGSKNNVVNYGIIKNAYQAVAVIGPSSGTKLTLNETTIENAYTNGLIGIGTSINARNLLIANCGQNLALGGGGTYNFTHCTVAAYSTAYIQHKEPTLVLTNYTVQGNTITAAALNASFTNCIFWGEQNGFVSNEVSFDAKGSIAPSVNFTKPLWRTQAPAGAGITVNNAIAADPQFDTVNTQQRIFNFRLRESSPAKNAGVTTAVNIDLDGKPRPVGPPDVGAYERH